MEMKPMEDLGQLFDLVMLYSGGADSRLMMHFALELGRKPFCVLIDYGQKHIKELEYAKKQLDDIHIPYWTVKVSGLEVDSGLTGRLKEQRWDNVHAMNVPGRNTIFIGIAYSLAENMGIQEIWYGPDYSDAENLFPDCYQDYVVRMNKVLAVSGVRPIKLRAPLLGWTKNMIVKFLKDQVGVDVEKELHSGYDETGDLPDDPDPDPEVYELTDEVEKNESGC